MKKFTTIAVSIWKSTTKREIYSRFSSLFKFKVISAFKTTSTTACRFSLYSVKYMVLQLKKWFRIDEIAIKLRFFFNHVWFVWKQTCNIIDNESNVIQLTQSDHIWFDAMWVDVIRIIQTRIVSSALGKTLVTRAWLWIIWEEIFFQHIFLSVCFVLRRVVFNLIGWNLKVLNKKNDRNSQKKTGIDGNMSHRSFFYDFLSCFIP